MALRLRGMHPGKLLQRQNQNLVTSNVFQRSLVLPFDRVLATASGARLARPGKTAHTLAKLRTTKQSSTTRPRSRTSSSRSVHCRSFGDSTRLVRTTSDCAKVKTAHLNQNETSGSCLQPQMANDELGARTDYAARAEANPAQASARSCH
jgi:hypothetical protein